ncbi:ATP-binding cassette domain-containing protein [Streptomyces sp. NPDC096339]|uniref:ATP-binding cassette domain-containing protein n=1 Tax=Streptomyces sp. NPDC096339 TaxID=3366086 RepID=UPI00381AA6D8
MTQSLARLFWFPVPRPGEDARLRYAARWQHWYDRACGDERSAAAEPSLHRAVFRVVRRDLFLGLLAAAVNGAAAYGAASALRTLLHRLTDDSAQLSSLLASGSVCVLLTLVAWLALNHTTFLAEVVAVGARVYVESRILLRGKGRGQNLTVPLEREAARVEAAWASLVMVALVLVTVAYSMTFFLVALGVAGVTALAITLLSAVVVYGVAKRLNTTYDELSARSARRVEVGTFAVDNTVTAWLHNWTDDLARRYTDRRAEEERSLKGAARLMAPISLLATMTPLIALLGAALTQLAVRGHVDVTGVLASIAVVGGLRSAANALPDLVQDIARGVSGHRAVARHLAEEPGVPDLPSVPSVAAGRHIAIVGAAGSGKTSVLRAVGRTAGLDGALFVPDEPWTVPGGLRENLMLHRRDRSDEEVRSALTACRLPAEFLTGYRTGEPPRSWGVSRGQGKRIELARALLAGPAPVLVDQPTSGLDDALADGLLAALLSGPWKDTTVVYVTDRPDEQEAADEVWTVADRTVVKVETRTGAGPKAAPDVTAPPVEEVAAEEVAAEAPVPAVASPAPGASRRSSTVRSLRRFGIGRISLIALVLLASREALTIVGDYVVAGGLLAADIRTAALWLAIAIGGGALLSIGGTLLLTMRTIAAASAHCVGYLAGLMNPRHHAAYRERIAQDRHGKITWDQRRVDETLPSLLLETLSAAAMLTATVLYVVVSSPVVLVALAVILAAYLNSAKRSGEVLGAFNTREVTATAALFEQVNALDRDGGRFETTTDGARAMFEWLRPGVAERAFATLDNAAARRWFSYKLDLLGLTFMAVVVAASVWAHLLGTVSAGMVLGVGLCYSLIAIFGRLGRCAIELRQVLDSADRLALPAAPVGSPTRAPGADGATLVSFSAVTYVNQRDGTALLEDFSESFDTGDVVVITGPSGIGKSTFANLVIGHLRPASGTVATLGSGSSYLAGPHRGEILFLTAAPVFRPGPLANHFAGADPAELERLAERLALSDVVGRLPGGFSGTAPVTGLTELSKSEQQRLALLGVLSSRPAIAILDEATSELGTDEEVALMATLLAEAPGTLFFVITHNRKLAALATRRFHFTSERRLVAAERSDR